MRRSFAHWSFCYAGDKAIRVAFEWTHPGSPWLPRQAVRYLNAWLRPEHRGLEWGSGRSTRWLSDRVAHVTSVEHNPAWHAKVVDMLRDKRPDEVTLLLEKDINRYVACASRFAAEALDFVLVDGIARDRCARCAMPKLRRQGLLIVDNINRYLPSPSRSPESLAYEALPATPLWSDVAAELSSWPREWLSDGVTDTAIWTKP